MTLAHAVKLKAALAVLGTRYAVHPRSTFVVPKKSVIDRWRINRAEAVRSS
jgi:hypothetical protein